MHLKPTRYSLTWCLVISTFISACSVYKPYYSKEASNWTDVPAKDATEVAYTVFLIGDVGQPETKRQEPSLKLLQSQLEKASANSACIFLGDNIYYLGMSPEDAGGRKEDERRINEQLNVFKNYKGEKYIIPGNHDWSNGQPQGMASALRQEAYIEKQFPVTNTFVPDSACPGPYEVLLSDDLVLIALNTQWWLHDQEKPYGENNYCGVANEVDLLAQLESLIAKHKGKHILVVGHHPLFSNGFHGGHFTIKDHIFPLTLIREWAFLPLPVIGSLYPLARKYGGVVQDIAHPRYQSLKQGLLTIFDKYPNVIYAAGHEHSLQYFKYKSQHHIISGSGCKQNFAADGSGATFTARSKGFAKVMYYKNGEVGVEFVRPGESDADDGASGKTLYRGTMYAKVTPKTENFGPLKSFKDSTITASANAEYRASWFKGLILGQHYRKEWREPVKMDVLDLATEKGGLEPYKKGGGKQTASLKLRNADGQEYTLRLLQKDAGQGLPAALRETIAEDIVQDQYSSQHPYAPFVIPKLADAAGVYHTNPKLVYVPRDPRLGQWIDEFSDKVALLEEDADNAHTNIASLGNAKKFVGTDKLIEELHKDNDYQVNQTAFARVRLFDMLIGDWDRHEGQWRWFYKKTDHGRTYFPIPEDRDIAFFKGDGALPWLSRRKWAVRNFQSFTKEFEDPIGINLSGINLDRPMLNSITKEEFIAQAVALQQSVSDKDIEEAIKQWPQNIYTISGPKIIANLKSRRDQLPALAAAYYKALAREVDILGSDKHERFVVKRLNNDQTEVTVYKLTKEGEQKQQFYHRVFSLHETKELRLYGLGGNDVFEITGDVKKGILIRLIAGAGEDKITDQSRVRKGGKQLLVYDYTKENNTIQLGKDAADHTAAVAEVNAYDRLGYKFPYIGPRLSFAYNVDDGLFLGGGFIYKNYKFRKKPFANEHILTANMALKTQAFNFRYIGNYTQVVGKWDASIVLAALGPQYVLNYFGLGNETKPLPEHPLATDIRFYRVKFTQYRIAPVLKHDLTSFFQIGIGPTYDRFSVQETPGRFISTPEANVSPDVFNINQFAGGRFYANIGATTNPVNPRLGVRFTNEASYNYAFQGEKSKFTKLASEFTFYWSPVLPFQATLAARFGGATNIGSFPFYQANTLGGLSNLRGYRRTRFAGRSAVYQNTELRVELFKFNLYLFPGKLGILGLADHGRVYTDNEISKRWHHGVGGGIWVDVLKQAVITATYTAGEERLANVTFGFLF